MKYLIRLIKRDDIQVVLLLGFMNLMSWGTIYSTKSVPRAFRAVYLLAIFIALACHVIKKHHAQEKKTAADWFFIIFPILILLLTTGFGFYLFFGLMAGIAQYYGFYEYVIIALGLAFGAGIIYYIVQSITSAVKGRKAHV